MPSRVLVLAAACAILVACARPAPASAPTSGEQQAIAAWLYQFRLADKLWAEDRAVLRERVVACPDFQQPLAPSSAIETRDGLRVDPAMLLSSRIPEDTGRGERNAAARDFLEGVHQDAIADWHLRRAAALQDRQHCEQAAAALDAADAALADARSQAASVAREAGLP